MKNEAISEILRSATSLTTEILLVVVLQDGVCGILRSKASSSVSSKEQGVARSIILSIRIREASIGIDVLFADLVLKFCS